jgi:type II secretory pathway component PulF
VYLYDAATIAQDAVWSRTKEAFAVILPALTGILGTVIGFYFGKGSR